MEGQKCHERERTLAREHDTSVPTLMQKVISFCYVSLIPLNSFLLFFWF